MTGTNDELDTLKDQLSGITGQLEDMRVYTDAIVDTINEPIVVLDKDLKVKNATKGFYNKFNITEGAIEGHYFYELKSCPWNDPELVEKLMSIIVKGDSFSDHEVICQFPASGERVFKMNARHLENLQDKHLIIISINDITDSRFEKNKLIENKRKLEERIRLAVESADMGTWDMDPETGKVIWDDRCQELFGFKGSVLTYEEFLNRLHPDDRPNTDKTIKSSIQGSDNGKYFIEYRTQSEEDQDMKWLKATGRAYFDANGKAIHFAGTVMDITQQKLNEQLLRESEERFRMASDAAAAMIWLSATDKMCNYFNKSWLQFTGKTFEQEKGNGWMAGVHPDDYTRYAAIFVENFDAKKEFYMEYRLLRHDGAYRWISDSGAPRFSPQGIFEGYIGTCIDIHDQKMTQEELEKMVADRTQLLSDAISNLEISNQNLEEFAYVASHDLQEPLRKIQTFANRLQEKNGEHLSENTKLYLSKITKASLRMSRLIGDLLNYSRLQSTDSTVEIIDLNDVLTNVLGNFDMIIQEKKAVINVTKLPAIRSVGMRMYQLFHNLISNALKFSKENTSPILKIYSEDLTNEARENYPLLKKDTNYTMITFEDNGIGFNEEFTEKIFNIFQRLNGVGEYEGTGIGLAICKKIVSNLHGIIFAESTENEGAFFRIILPTN
ncbi:MAG: PAS domain S-box protein [Ferruginibacter sp.]